jgi:M6 family metalloprotease-like protein
MTKLISFLSLFNSLIFLSACGVDSSQSSSTSTSSTLAKATTTQSSIPMLAILVNYSNAKISSSESVWASKLFGSSEGELNHYYMQASANYFKFTQANESYGEGDNGVVSIELNKNHPNTDVDSSYFIDRTYPDLASALKAADIYVDFSNFDSNADGHISSNELLITFIVAGYEDAYEGRHVRNGIWAHQNCMEESSNIPTLDAVSLMGCANEGNFALFGEKHNVSNPHDATIGIIAHELGHAAFNLPDLYNTANPNSGGIGYFGIMGSGTWGSKNSSEFAGNTPTHFCAWSKMYNGWLEPYEKSDSLATLTETASEEYNIIKIPINSSSYYLLENRNNSGYDMGLDALDGDFNGGVAIWKIDESKLTEEYVYNNIVNADTQNKGVDLVEAVNGYIDYYGEAGNENALYYEGNVNSFSTLVSNISQRGSKMTLNIK